MEQENQTSAFKKIDGDLSRFQVVPKGTRIHSWSEAVESLQGCLNQKINPKYGPVQMGRLLGELKILGITNAGEVLAFIRECEGAPCSFGQAYGQRLKAARARQKTS